MFRHSTSLFLNFPFSHQQNTWRGLAILLPLQQDSKTRISGQHAKTFTEITITKTIILAMTAYNTCFLFFLVRQCVHCETLKRWLSRRR